MNFEVFPTPRFKKDLIYYKVKRKFNHVQDDIDLVIKEIE